LNLVGVSPGNPTMSDVSQSNIRNYLTYPGDNFFDFGFWLLYDSLPLEYHHQCVEWAGQYSGKFFRWRQWFPANQR